MSVVRRAGIVVAAVLAVAGALTGTGSGTAMAAADAGQPRQGGATATLAGLKTYGQAVVHGAGEDVTTRAGLFEMAVDGGGALQTYGIDIDNPTQQQARYEEAPWSASSLHDNRDAGRIRWILRHSYPQVNDLRRLAKWSGAKRLSAETAAAGTQVAIWRFSDRADVEAVDPAAEKLADHLRRAARQLPEPEASLSLGPMDVSGRHLSGSDVSGGEGVRPGPVRVRTNAQSVTLTPASVAASPAVRAVGRDGKPLTSARDGGRLYFELADDEGGGSSGGPASGSLTVQAATKVPVGRAFTGLGGHATTQTQILAGSSQSTVSATVGIHRSGNGAIPAATAKKNCADGSVDVAVANAGERPFRFALAGKDREVAAGSTGTIAVPVQEDQPYRISVTGADGFGETFTGVLDCATARAVNSRQAPGSQDAAGTAPRARPATVGGEGERTDIVGGGGDLAESGSGNTPLVLGVATGLVFIGVVAVLAVRRREPEESQQRA